MVSPVKALLARSSADLPPDLRFLRPQCCKIVVDNFLKSLFGNMMKYVNMYGHVNLCALSLDILTQTRTCWICAAGQHII
jgi:hypothetical protein